MFFVRPKISNFAKNWRYIVKKCQILDSVCVLSDMCCVTLIRFQVKVQKHLVFVTF
jgi:hypothetical protein